MEQILHSKIYGQQGKPFIILHGLLGMLDNWITLGKKFSENYTVHLLDQRNHGKSFHHSVMNYDAMADDLKNYLDTHNLQKVNLLGHSMGGKTVMNFACRYPKYVEKLLVVDISPRKYPMHHQDIFEAINSVNLNTLNSRKEAEKKLNTKIKDLVQSNLF